MTILHHGCKRAQHEHMECTARRTLLRCVARRRAATIVAKLLCTHTVIVTSLLFGEVSSVSALLRAPIHSHFPLHNSLGIACDLSIVRRFPKKNHQMTNVTLDVVQLRYGLCRCVTL